MYNCVLSLKLNDDDNYDDDNDDDDDDDDSNCVQDLRDRQVIPELPALQDTEEFGVLPVMLDILDHPDILGHQDHQETVLQGYLQFQGQLDLSDPRDIRVQQVARVQQVGLCNLIIFTARQHSLLCRALY